MRSWHQLRALAVIVGVGTSPLPATAAAPALVFDSHINAPSTDLNAELLRIVNQATPITITSLLLNGKCQVTFFQSTADPRSLAGERKVWAFTADKAAESVAHLHGGVSPMPLILAVGGPVAVIVPAVTPVDAFGGFTGAGACGMTLNSLRAITNLGDADWTAPPSAGSN